MDPRSPTQLDVTPDASRDAMKLASGAAAAPLSAEVAAAGHPRERGVNGRLRREQREKEEALGPVGRIELALALGLRAKALRGMITR